MNPSAPNQQNATGQPQPVQPVIVPAGAYQPPPQNGASPLPVGDPSLVNTLQPSGQPQQVFAPQGQPATRLAIEQAPNAPPVTGKPPTPVDKNGKPKTAPNSTQNSLQIAEVRDGIVIMNDGSYRAVVMVKSINFDLMSPQEQEGVEYSYQAFLNSLFFQIQIFIRSRKVDLRPYIEKLDKIRSEHDNMLLALLMEDYIGYMDNLSQETNIMDKSFYVVIPFFPVIDAQAAITQSKNFLGGFAGLFNKSEQHVTINEPDLEAAKTELKNRVQAVLGGLQQCGIQGLPLDTQELIELYYDTYNPDTATRQKLKEFSGMNADIITKGEGNAPQPHLDKELS